METPSNRFPDIYLKKFKASKYSHIYQKDGYYALYHALYMNLLYVKKDTFDIFCKIKTGISTRETINSHEQLNQEAVIDIIGLLYDNNLIVNSSYAESILNTENLSKISIDIQIMYLILTDKCNLSCRYCFIENAIDSNHLHVSMSLDDLKKSVDLFDKLSINNSENRTIILYGGEPLLNKNTLRQGICYIRKSLKDIKINLITNATKLTREDASFFRDYNIDVSISIDGLESINDTARVFSDNDGCFRKIKQGYNNLKLENVPNIGASITVGNHNIHNLKNNIEKLFEKFDFNGVGFNFLVDLPNNKNPLSVDIERATKEVLDAFIYLREKGIYEDRIMRKLKPFAEETIHLKDCGAIGNQIVVSPDGSIGPCHGFLYNRKYFHKSITDLNELTSNPDFIEWSKRFPLNMDKCKDCDAIGICGGGCPYQAYVSKGSIWELDERMCQHNKILLEWAIWDVFENMNNAKVPSNG